MQWFIQGIRQLADFKGRATRQEYWMFTLWDVIFLLVLMLAASLVFSFVITSPENSLPISSSYGPTVGSLRVIGGMMAAGLCYGIAMLLPRLAITARRLHDQGRNVWMLLVGLIPFIGPIWLLILMLAPGQEGANRYGPDPKTSSPPQGNSAPHALRGGGIMLVVASCVVLWSSVGLVPTLLTLAAGVCLLLRKVKNAFLLLLIAASISFFLNVMGIWKYIQFLNSASEQGRNLASLFWLPGASMIFSAGLRLMLVLFAASVLWHRQAAARKTAVAVIVFSGAWLLTSILLNANLIADELVTIGGLRTMYYHQLTLNTFVPVAFLILAGEFLAGWKPTGGEEHTQWPV